MIIYIIVGWLLLGFTACMIGMWVDKNDEAQYTLTDIIGFVLLGAVTFIIVIAMLAKRIKGRLSNIKVNNPFFKREKQ